MAIGLGISREAGRHILSISFCMPRADITLSMVSTVDDPSDSMRRKAPIDTPALRARSTCLSFLASRSDASRRPILIAASLSHLTFIVASP